MRAEALSRVAAEARAAVARRLLAREGDGDPAAVYAEAMLAVARATAASLAEERGLTPCWPAERALAPASARGVPPEALGAVYEAVLGLEARRAPSGAWQLYPVHARRKGAGAFYTGNPLTGPTVERVLKPLLAQDTGGRPLRVIDPAMGAGAFLLAALRALAARRPAERGRVARESLFGVDSDPLAVEIARLALWLEAGDRALSLEDLAENLRCGDGLAPGGEGSFDAVLGNPPWETLRPDSREFFASRDPAFRRLGKREALRRAEELCAADPSLDEAWRELKKGQRGLAARTRAAGRFVLQGRGSLATYKLFLERGLALLKDGGRLGLILPSALYADLGAAALRRHLLDCCRWEWLYVFENRDGFFDIHRSYKYGPVVVEKGGRTEALRVAFMRRDLGEWRAPEQHAYLYPRADVRRFSPEASALLEIQTSAELGLLERIFEHSLPLRDSSDPPLRYAREVDLTNHAALFRAPEELLAQGLRRDRLGRFLDAAGKVAALPLYQGVMIGACDFAAAACAGGPGSRADWLPVPWEDKRVISRFALALEDARRRVPEGLRPRLVLRDVQNASNERTLIAALVPGFPCGNTLPSLSSGDPLQDLTLLPALCSFPLDRVLRLKMSQNHVNWFYLRELPLPRCVPERVRAALLLPAASLALAGDWFAPEWLRLRQRLGLPGGFRRGFALTQHERLRLRCVLDAAAALLYGLEWDDFRRLLAGSDLPAAELKRPDARRRLDPKGFWRVDRGLDPELRHTVLALLAFADLLTLVRARGLEDAVAEFCGQGGAGWQLPEELALRDFGLGQGAAAGPLPVRARLGPRFLPWQEREDAAASWAECGAIAAAITEERELEGAAPAHER